MDFLITSPFQTFKIEVLVDKQHSSTNPIATEDIEDGAITSVKLEDGCITEGKLDQEAVTTENICPRAMTNQLIAFDAVGTENIQDGAIENEKLADGCISTAKLENQAVTMGKIADQAITAQHVAHNTLTNQQLSVIAQIPVGSVMDFAGGCCGMVPPGWLNCLGQAVHRVTYRALFAVIGTAYGVGDGATTFNVPDFRGRASFGVDLNHSSHPEATAQRITMATANALTNGGVGGGETHKLTVEALPSHCHGSPHTTEKLGCDFNVDSHLAKGILVKYASTTGFAGGNLPLNNMPPFLLMTKIIYAGV